MHIVYFFRLDRLIDLITVILRSLSDNPTIFGLCLGLLLLTTFSLDHRTHFSCFFAGLGLHDSMPNLVCKTTIENKGNSVYSQERACFLFGQAASEGG